MSSSIPSIQHTAACVARVLLVGLMAGTACRGEPFETDGLPQLAASADCSQCHGRRTTANTLAEIVDDIIDTHADDQWLDADGNFVIEETPRVEGYVFEEPLSWVEPDTGYVVRGSAGMCAASCHDGHEANAGVGREWRMSGHGDVNAAAFAHVFTSGACLQCHHGAGWVRWQNDAAAALPPANEWGYLITCNTCHDGSGYPSRASLRLRWDSEVVTLQSGTATAGNEVIDGDLILPRSATCVSCHQGRESGASMYKRLVAEGADPYVDAAPNTVFGVPFSDFNSHVGHAGAGLYSSKGYEYRGKTYSNGNIMHQSATCVGCHMVETDNEGRGGHTMRPAGCERCHGIDWHDFDHAGRLVDTDGDGQVGYPYAELEALKQRLGDALASESIHYDAAHFPFFFRTGDPADRGFSDAVFVWEERQILAAFNLHFVNGDHGMFAHNFRYAAQLLRDAYEDLTGAPLAGSRPGSIEDRPARDYTTY